MWTKKTAAPGQIMICYCLFALIVTMVANQSGAFSQEKNGADKQSKAEPKTTTNDPASHDAASHDAAKKSESKNSNSKSAEKSVDTKTSGLQKSSGAFPVVGIKTGSNSDKESLLNYQSDAFDVVTPGWFEQPVSTNNESDVEPFFVIGFDEQQLEKEVETRVQSEINRYVDQFLGSTAHQFVQFTEAEKKKLLVRSEVVPGIYFDGQKQVPVDFYFAHLKFDNEFESLATSKWVEKRQQSRLIQFGLVGVASFLIIGFVFGGLRLNTVTSGFYQGRLQFFVSVVILGILATGIYFGTRIDWI